MLRKLHCTLLIDDNEFDNFFHTKILKRHGWVESVVSAESGDEALQLLQGSEEDQPLKPDLIFLDINMPGMDGWEFLEHYKVLENNPHTDAVVVMLSTSLNPADRERAKEQEGVSEFLTKPLSMATLDEIFGNFFSEGE